MITKTIHWEYKNIKDTMIQVIDGDRGKEYPKENEFLNEGYCLFLTANNITKNGFRLDNKIFISEERDKKLGKGKLKPNDIILTTRGSVGNIALFNDTIPYTHIRINSGMVILRANTKEILPSYLEILLCSGYVSRQITKVVYGSAQPQLTVKTINSIKLPIPDLKSQEYITSVIKSSVNIIDNIDNLIETKKKLKQALMQKLLTGQIRFPGYGKPVTKTGDVPEGWERIKIKEIGAIVTGSTPSMKKNEYYGGHLPWVTAQDFQGKYINTSKIKLTEQGLANTRVVPKGSVLITCIASIGLNAIADVELATNQQINSIVVNAEHDNEFIYYIMNYHSDNMKRIAGKTAVPIINKSEFGNYSITLPQSNEQKLISNVLRKCDEEIAIFKFIMQQKLLEKQGIMNMLFAIIR